VVLDKPADIPAEVLPNLLEGGILDIAIGLRPYRQHHVNDRRTADGIDSRSFGADGGMWHGLACSRGLRRRRLQFDQ
jgi:hypothetical protein